MSKVYGRLLTPPKQSFFLFGLRGVGKSTWAKARFPNAVRIDLLDQTLHGEYLVAPARFADRLRAMENGSWVVVDEIQRLPELLNEFPLMKSAIGLRSVFRPKWIFCFV